MTHDEAALALDIKRESVITLKSLGILKKVDKKNVTEESVLEYLDRRRYSSGRNIFFRSKKVKDKNETFEYKSLLPKFYVLKILKDEFKAEERMAILDRKRENYNLIKINFSKRNNCFLYTFEKKK